uniref:Uncharacterized protein n=1 Tax=Acrobeloides nanus TaxID=290746 RepID=A0A914D5N1_9BILA
MKEFRGGIIRLFDKEQDGAPLHRAEETRDLKTSHYGAFWKTKHVQKPHQSIEELKKSLVKAWNDIPQEVIDRVVDDFPERLKKCIDAQGGHFENK